MKIIDKVAISIVFLLSFATFSVAKDAANDAVVLMPIVATGGIERDTATSFENALIESLSSGYKVYYGKKVQDTVEKVYRTRSAETKAGKDCDDTKCLQDIAMAFQSELIAVCNVKKMADGYILSLKIQNVVEDTVAYSKTVPCDKCNEYDAIRALKKMIPGSSSTFAVQPDPEPLTGQSGALFFSGGEYSAPSSSSTNGQANLTPPDKLDQMLAPIALYPDALLGQILIAATYPMDVADAGRWSHDPFNSERSGDDLTEALQQQPWDPSVKSLVSFPNVLKMMNDNISWTENLGREFLASQAAVMDSVQRLRKEALTAGTLSSSSNQKVREDDRTIIIESANPTVVYVPTYNPVTAYPAWRYPDRPPYYFPWAGVAVGAGIGFAVIAPYWGWNHFDWGRRHVGIDANKYNRIIGDNRPANGGVWRHDPNHDVRRKYSDQDTSRPTRGREGEHRHHEESVPVNEGSRITAPNANTHLSPTIHYQRREHGAIQGSGVSRQNRVGGGQRVQERRENRQERREIKNARPAQNNGKAAPKRNNHPEKR